MKRRDFITSSCKLCVSLGAAGFVMSELTSCASALPVFKTSLNQDSVTVPLSSFITSGKEPKESNLLILRDLQMPYDVLLVKKSPSDYLALYMKCTHQENGLTATPEGLHCSAHGSSFDLEGNVKKEPALAPLRRFPVLLENDHLILNLKS